MCNCSRCLTCPGCKLIVPKHGEYCDLCTGEGDYCRPVPIPSVPQADVTADTLATMEEMSEKVKERVESLPESDSIIRFAETVGILIYQIMRSTDLMDTVCAVVGFIQSHTSGSLLGNLKDIILQLAGVKTENSPVPNSMWSDTWKTIEPIQCGPICIRLFARVLRCLEVMNLSVRSS
jgi:hypothetical protein